MTFNKRSDRSTAGSASRGRRTWWIGVATVLPAVVALLIDANPAQAQSRLTERAVDSARLSLSASDIRPADLLGGSLLNSTTETGGTILGTFIQVGGPPLANGQAPRLLIRGTVYLYSNELGIGGPLAFRRTGRDGKFVFRVRPGRYFLGGTNSYIYTGNRPMPPWTDGVARIVRLGSVTRTTLTQYVP